MFSTPSICSSIGLATVSAMVSGFAPGNCAVTMTDGGTTSGYSEIGRLPMAISPPRRISDDKTPAEDRAVDEEFRDVHAFPGMNETGRYLALDTLTSGGRHIAVHGDLGRRDDGIRAHALEAVDHDDFIFLQARPDNAQAVDDGPERDGAVIRLVVGIDDHDVFLVLVGADGAVIDQHRRLRRRAADAHLGVEAGGELAGGIVEDRADADRAGGRVELVVDRVEMALVRIAVLVGEAHADGNSCDACVAGCAFGHVVEVGLLVDLELDVNRVDRDDRGQHRGVDAVVDQVAAVISARETRPVTGAVMAV